MPQVIIVGGCHVAGYGIDEHPPFWQEPVRLYGTENVLIISHVSMKNSIDQLNQIEILSEDCIAILQLGHFDVWKELSFLNTIAKLHNSIKNNKKYGVNKLNLNRKIDNKKTKYFPLVRSFAVGLSLSVLDYLLVKRSDREKALRSLSRDFDNVVSSLNNVGIKKIFALSPFPTSTPRLNSYRLSFSSIIKRQCQINNAVFVDVWKSLAFTIGPMTILREGVSKDGVHLSERGHDIVSRILADHVKDIIGG